MQSASRGTVLVGLLFVSAVVLTLRCSEQPPPAEYPAGWTEDGPTPGQDSTSEPSHATPATPASGGRAQQSAPYPATPKAAPPVSPLPGKGLGVPLQRYVVVDQFGYRRKMAKVAILVDPERGWNGAENYQPGAKLEIRAWSDGKVAWQGAPARWNGGALDDSSGDRGAWLDFSSLETKGLYYVFDPAANVRSHPFEIDDDIYRPVLKAASRMYYFNRANFAKKPPHSCVGKRCWSLGPDYLGPGQDSQARSVSDRNNRATERDLSGGWWDAGDVNKYVTFSSEPVHQLLTAYEEHPSAFTDDFGIPESGNGLPDIIDELRVEISWLKKMQPEDLKGGALIKVGVVDYGDPIPDRSRLPRYYYPAPCSSATIVVAGQFAHAALAFKSFPELTGEVADLTRRAQRAWSFYQSNPKSDACDDGTIKAGDADRSLAEQAEDVVVAAAYLYALTGNAEFSDHVVKGYGSTHPFQADDWSAYGQTKGDALLFYASLANADAETKRAIQARKTGLMKSSNLYDFHPELDLYRAYMRPTMYHWGSNNQRASVGNTNYAAVRWGFAKGEAAASYRERAAGMLHSFHGVNPMQLVYLTNMYAYGGDACADEIFHAWFRTGDAVWSNARTSALGPAPGYVPGGPNQQYCDGQKPAEHACARSPVRDQPRGKAYVDTNAGWEPSNPYDQSWQLTEPGIYYQASYVRLVSKFVD